jgi:hypothetical protein
MSAMIDEADRDEIVGHRWHVSFTGNGPKYAARHVTKKGKRTVLKMHRQLMGDPVGLVVDHINGDTLDNRRKNLRICTRRENAQNRIGKRGRRFKGVARMPSGRWQAHIRVDGQLQYLGTFDADIEAAAAYARAEREMYGSFALSARPNAETFDGIDARSRADKGLPMRVFGENHHKAKLNPAQVIELRSDRHSGMTFSGIAKKFGITKASARAVVKRQSWAHVKDAPSGYIIVQKKA